MKNSIYVSPSTQENNVGAVNYGTEEKRMNEVADVVVRELTRHSITAYRNKPEMTLAQVVDDSNAKAPGLHFAIHSNASGRPDGGARGGEVFCHKFGGVGEQMARNVYAELEPLTPVADRGVKEGANAYGPGKPMYELAYTDAPAALVEIDFHDDPGGAAWIIDHIEQIGVAIAKGLLKTLGITWQAPVVPKPEPKPAPQGMAILAKPSATVAQAQEWAKQGGATAEFISLAPLFWNLAPLCGGVDPVVAYCQSAKETGYGRFGGVLDASYKNPCGMKKKEGGGDYDKEAHQRFNSWDTGIAAQCDHLALYAGANGYPKAGSPDPRHFPFIKGTAPIVEALGGKWAPSLTYGQDIVKMVQALRATKEPPKKTPQDITAENAKADGAIGDLEYWKGVFSGKITANPEYIQKAFDNYHSVLVKAKKGAK